MASWAEEVDIGVDEDDDGANEGEGEPTAMGEATATTGGGNGEAGDGDVLRDSQGVVPSGPTYNVDMDSGSMSEDEMMDAEEYDERYGDQVRCLCSPWCACMLCASWFAFVAREMVFHHTGTATQNQPPPLPPPTNTPRPSNSCCGSWASPTLPSWSGWPRTR